MKFFTRTHSAPFLHASCLLLAAFLLAGCATRGGPWGRRMHPPSEPPREIEFVVTGYCSCATCCGWSRNWYGRPVVRTADGRTLPKKVGVTASGAQAHPGTVAADPRIPFGTIVHVPGYGYGVVEDRGGAIKGASLDVYFHRHSDAQRWGRQRLKVLVWDSPK